MCGIFFCLSSSVDQCDCNLLNDRIFRRGPDSWQTLEQTLVNDIKIQFTASVLNLRGPHVSQPLVDDIGNVLLWNGEIFYSPELNEDKNDTRELLGRLCLSETDESILSVFSSIQGPWACIYWQKKPNKLWFGRDIFGRRSLLMNIPNNAHKCFCLSSLASKTSDNAAWIEVPTAGIFCLKITCFEEEKLNITYHHRFPQIFHADFEYSFSSNNVNKDASKEWLIETCKEITNYKRINLFISETFCPQNIPPFSCLLPSEADLQAFSNHSMNDLILSQNFLPIVEKFIEILSRAVEVRVKNVPKICKQCKMKYSKINIKDSVDFKEHEQEEFMPCLNHSCSHCKVAVLFSGGIDSTVLALLADKFIPIEEPIDLFNVAFESKSNVKEPAKNRKQKFKLSTKNEDQVRHYDVPDRLTGLDALAELQKLNSKRKWNFINIDITVEELQRERSSSICHVIAPSNTVLDDSIGCALWFAARGSGLLFGDKEKIMYTSPAEVVLVGMGADEQLAGYSRHRVKFQTDDWKALMQELNLEMRRISVRNLGRDDRIISDHGRESRLPFLDEEVVSFLNSLSVWQKANLTLPRGIGEKLLLRLAARHLGLQKIACLPKRAIQFGSRIAKAENVREKGDDICQRL